MVEQENEEERRYRLAPTLTRVEIRSLMLALNRAAAGADTQVVSAVWGFSEEACQAATAALDVVATAIMAVSTHYSMQRGIEHEEKLKEVIFPNGDARESPAEPDPGPHGPYRWRAIGPSRVGEAPSAVPPDDSSGA